MYSTMDKQTSSSNNLKMTTSSTTGEQSIRVRLINRKSALCEWFFLSASSPYDVIAPFVASDSLISMSSLHEDSLLRSCQYFLSIPMTSLPNVFMCVHMMTENQSLRLHEAERRGKRNNSSTAQPVKATPTIRKESLWGIKFLCTSDTWNENVFVIGSAFPLEAERVDDETFVDKLASNNNFLFD